MIGSKSVLAALPAFGVVPPPGSAAALDRASRLRFDRDIAKGIVPKLAAPHEEFEHQAAAEPCVPTLCLTSEDDQVIQAAGVRSYADDLKGAQPKRDVSVRTLRGAHVTLPFLDGAKYDEAIVELLHGRCGYPESIKP